MTRFLSTATIIWGLAYGSLRAVWALLGAPDLPPLGDDLIVFTGWAPASLCLAAAGIAIGFRLTAYSRPLILAAWAVAGSLLIADALFLLDIVGILTGGISGAGGFAALASRAACALGAGLLIASTVVYQRHGRDACLRCGRTDATVPLARVPGWARAGAWIAVVGCLVRVVAQWSIGFDGIPLNGSVIVFEVGFLLAGTLLPLALVHGWGRVWPRWVLLLRGRRVPRWLVLGPAVTFSVGLVVYFGIALAQITFAAVTGGPDEGGFPMAFYWIAVPAYWVWGLGMGAASVAYFQLTRKPCATCGRGAPRLETWSPSHTSVLPAPSAKPPYAV